MPNHALRCYPIEEEHYIDTDEDDANEYVMPRWNHSSLLIGDSSSDFDSDDSENCRRNAITLDLRGIIANQKEHIITLERLLETFLKKRGNRQSDGIRYYQKSKLLRKRKRRAAENPLYRQMHK